MGAQENKASARRFMEEVINGGNVGLVDALTAPDFVDHSIPPGAPPGIAGFKAWIGSFRAAFPDLHYTIEDELADGDRVVQRVKGKGTMEGDFMGMPAAHKTAEWEEVHFTRFADGRAVEHWGVVDQLAMLVALGFAQAPGQPAGVGG